MSLSAIIWNTKPEAKTNNDFFNFLKASITTYNASTYHQVEHLFADHSDISTIITIIEPTDTRTIQQLRKLKAKQPRLQLFTTFCNGRNYARQRLTSLYCRKNRVIQSLCSERGKKSSAHDSSVKMLEKLNPLQFDIMILLAQDKSRSDISRLMDISKQDVTAQCHKMQSLLGLADAQSLRSKARELRFILPSKASLPEMQS